MDSEEIARRVHNLKISSSSREDPFLIPTDLVNLGIRKLESCLVGKVFSSKAVNRDTFRVQMPHILQAKESIDIEVIGENIFLLNFSSPIDRNHALLDGPWTFFKDLVIFEAPVGLQKSTDLVFDEMPIWVQCHNIPLAYMNLPILRILGERIGKVVEVDAREDGNCSGKFARIRVILDITKPLKPGLWVKQELSQEELCILLLYERLPNFCYICGKLGHVQRDCEIKEGEDSEIQYGNWIRASSTVGDIKYHHSKPNTPISSATPSVPSLEVADRSEEPIDNSLPLTNQTGSVSSMEKSVTDDNIVLPLDKQKLFESNMELVNLAARTHSSSDLHKTEATDDTTMSNPVKRKWKRLARGSSSNSLRISDNSSVLAPPRRSMQEQGVFTDQKNITRVEEMSTSECITNTAVAALQSRRSP